MKILSICITVNIQVTDRPHQSSSLQVATVHPLHPDRGFLILLLPQACPRCWDTLGLLMQKDDSTAARWSHLVSNFTTASRWGIRPKLISLPIKGYQDLFPASFHFWGLTEAFRGPWSLRACPLNCIAQLPVWSSARCLIKKIWPELTFKEYAFVKWFWFMKAVEHMRGSQNKILQLFQ